MSALVRGGTLSFADLPRLKGWMQVWPPDLIAFRAADHYSCELLRSPCAQD